MDPAATTSTFSTDTHPDGTGTTTIERFDNPGSTQHSIQDTGREVQALQPLPIPHHPLALVPPEILSEIFILAGMSWHDKYVPLQVVEICLVCQRWRKIALETPHLWNTMYLTNPRRIRSDIVSIRRWADRAGSVPMVMTIHPKMPHPHPAGPIETCPLDLEALVEFVVTRPSFKFLSIRCFHVACMQNFIVNRILPSVSRQGLGYSGGWSAISTLEIHGDLWGPVGKKLALEMQANHWFKRLPRVKSLGIRNWSWYQVPELNIQPVPHLDLSGALELSLRCNLSPRWILDSLKTCKASLCELLIDFGIKGGLDDDDVPPNAAARTASTTRCQLGQLRKLTLKPLWGDDEARIIGRLAMPALEHLDFSFRDFVDFSKEDRVTGREGLLRYAPCLVAESDLGRTIAPLRYLRFRYVCLSASALGNISDLLPSLVHLVLEDVMCNSGFFGADPPSTPGSSAIAFPRLEVLELLKVRVGYPGFKFDLNDIWTFCRARRHISDDNDNDDGRGRRMRKVVVQVAPLGVASKLLEDNICTLEMRLREEGLDCSVSLAGGDN